MLSRPNDLGAVFATQRVVILSGPDKASAKDLASGHLAPG